MLFGVHNHYTNNSGYIGKFNHACFPFLFSEVPVRVTDVGLTIFNLDKRLPVAEKLKLATILNDKLYAEFGNGVSFATCATSDCIEDAELTPFFEGIRKFDSSIVTIHVSSLSPGGHWASKPEDGSVDHLLDDRAINNMAEEVVGILGPQDTDKAEPAGGWDAFERSLNKIYVMSLAEIKPSLLSASNDFGVGMKPPRL